jgi:hypothetical protein
MDEKAGNSSYNSLQIKAENRFAHGVYLLASYTLSKTLTNSEYIQSEMGQGTMFSPFQRGRNKSLSMMDMPQYAQIAVIYDLPVGQGKRFRNQSGPLNKVIGGWKVTSIVRLDSAVPFLFTSATFCNVPSQFSAGCAPAILPGANPFAQSKGSFNPAEPLFNRAAFEPNSDFNFGFGDGARVSNVRGFPAHNQDLGLMKDVKITERVGLEIRLEAFNVWNWHIFTTSGGAPMTNLQPFNEDVSSPTFGMWTGDISPPRNCQLGLKLTF